MTLAVSLVDVGVVGAGGVYFAPDFTGDQIDMVYYRSVTIVITGRDF